ncbi:MAG: 16S rRNA processing protein RimM [Pelagibacteraceae bacterium]|nr:16S rRNA processing protein RimM [Pelagibacteraceae bacterium]MBT6197946.1 16S rRNA processing protein RimM [Pelagibacteraceae bacterium]
MNKSDLVHVGTFGTAIGLKGEIKINLLTSDVEVFKSFDCFYNFDCSIEWKFDSIAMRQKKCVAKLSHCKSRSEAEDLKNKKIYTSKENFPSTKDNEYYVSDLVDCKIRHNNGNDLGKVTDVNNFGAGDLLEIAYNNKKIYIPMNKENIVSVDIENKVIVVDPIKGIIDND